MPVYKANGIVLSRRNLGETDRILTLFCRDNGKISVVAKGSRRPNSKFGGATELFTHSNLLLATGKSLDVVSQCEIYDCFPALRSDLTMMAIATYMCELIDRLLEEHEVEPEVFDLFLSGLHLMQKQVMDPEVVLHAFEMRLLAHRGYTPELNICVRCHVALSGTRRAFSPTLGGILCDKHLHAHEDSFQITPETCQTLQILLTAEIPDLAVLQMGSDTQAQVQRCLRWYIRYRIDRDLKSAAFLDVLRNSG